MATYFIAALTSLVLSAAPGAQSVPAPGPAVAGPTLTLEQARSDFDLLRHALEEAHPGLYRYSGKAEMDRAFDEQRRRLDRPMSAAEFEAVLAHTLASIHCGHTSMTPDPQLAAAMRDARTLPLRVLVNGPNATVMLNDTADDATLHPGDQLLEINGHPIAEILDRMRSCLSADGDIQTGKDHDLGGRFAQYYWWLIDRSDRFSVKARDAAGKPITVVLAGVSDAQKKENHNPLNAPMMEAAGKLFHWAKEDPALRFLPGTDVAELRVGYFLGDNFPSALEAIFKTLAETKTTKLVIDLRGNGGGKDEYGALLVGYLTDKPFHYFDRIGMKTLRPTFSGQLGGYSGIPDALATGRVVRDTSGAGFLLTPALHPGLAPQQPAKNHFSGKVFVLTDGGTFSTAADFCAIVHHLGRGTFIGEETGGGYHGNNSGPMPTLTLPNSKAEIRFPMYAYYNAVAEDRFSRRGTIPDHAVELSIPRALRGEDSVLDEAVRLAR